MATPSRWSRLVASSASRVSVCGRSRRARWRSCATPRCLSASAAKRIDLHDWPYRFVGRANFLRVVAGAYIMEEFLGHILIGLFRVLLGILEIFGEGIAYLLDGISER